MGGAGGYRVLAYVVYIVCEPHSSRCCYGALGVSLQEILKIRPPRLNVEIALKENCEDASTI